jgi:hypothetical protein
LNILEDKSSGRDSISNRGERERRYKCTKSIKVEVNQVKYWAERDLPLYNYAFRKERPPRTSCITMCTLYEYTSVGQSI